jgi:hypothetical protein
MITVPMGDSKESSWSSFICLSFRAFGACFEESIESFLWSKQLPALQKTLNTFFKIKMALLSSWLTPA